MKINLPSRFGFYSLPDRSLEQNFFLCSMNCFVLAPNDLINFWSFLSSSLSDTKQHTLCGSLSFDFDLDGLSSFFVKVEFARQTSRNIFRLMSFLPLMRLTFTQMYHKWKGCGSEKMKRFWAAKLAPAFTMRRKEKYGRERAEKIRLCEWNDVGLWDGQ